GEGGAQYPRVLEYGSPPTQPNLGLPKFGRLYAGRSRMIRLRLTTAANVMRADQPDVASLAARHVQAGIVELQGLVADRRVDLAAVDARCVDAGLRKFIPSVPRCTR